MGNLYYEQLQKMSEESDNYEILKKLHKRVNKERSRINKLFKEEFEKGDYAFYYGMYLAYSNVITMIIALNNEKEGEDIEGN